MGKHGKVRLQKLYQRDDSAYCYSNQIQREQSQIDKYFIPMFGENDSNQSLDSNQQISSNLSQRLLQNQISLVSLKNENSDSSNSNFLIRSTMIVEQNLIHKQKKIKSDKKSIVKEKNVNPYGAYCRGHVKYIASLKTSIFGQSWRFRRTNKKNSKGETYFCFVTKVMDKSRNKLKNGLYAKRYDQIFLEKVKKSKNRKDDENITFAALEYLQMNQDVYQNIQTLNEMREKYDHSRHWALLLNEMLNDNSNQYEMN